MVSSTMWTSPLNFSTTHYSQVTPIPLDKKHHVSSLFHFFVELKFLFLDLMISFIKLLKTLDFSKHAPRVMKWWYYTWKHS